MIPLKDNVGAGGRPLVTAALMVVCVLVFLYELILPPNQLDEFFF